MGCSLFNGAANGPTRGQPDGQHNGQTCGMKAGVCLRAGRWLLLLGLLALGGCASEPPPVPPAELRPITTEVQPLRLWSASIGEADRGRFEPFRDADSLYVADGRGRVSSLSLDGGMRRWRRDLDVRLSSGVGGHDGQLYVSDIDGVVHALNAETGESLWQTAASSEVLVPVAANADVAVVRSADGRVVALDPADGEEQWTVSNTPPALTLNGYSQPRLLPGGVLVGLDDGRLLALNANNGKLIWESVISVPSGRSEVERLVDIDADIALGDAGIYLANYQGKAARVEPARGQIVWSVPLSAGSGIALREDRLVVIDEFDTIHLLETASGQILWSNDTMPGRRLSPPAFTDAGDIVVGDVEGFLHVLDSNTGEITGRIRLSDEPIVARPLGVDGSIIVQAVDGKIAAYRFAR